MEMPQENEDVSRGRQVTKIRHQMIRAAIALCNFDKKGVVFLKWKTPFSQVNDRPPPAKGILVTRTAGTFGLGQPWHSENTVVSSLPKTIANENDTIKTLGKKKYLSKLVREVSQAFKKNPFIHKDLHFLIAGLEKKDAVEGFPRIQT